MIINVRGISGSGKSTVVRAILGKLPNRTIYGVLGAGLPEAYGCTHTSLFVIGPYLSSYAGVDQIMKKGGGLGEMVDVLERYAMRGNVIFEGLYPSIRFLAPTVGAWMLRRKSEFIQVTLDTPYEVCLKSVTGRQKQSSRGERPLKLLEQQWHNFQSVTKRLTELGFRMETVSRENAADKILQWLPK